MSLKPYYPFGRVLCYIYVSLHSKELKEQNMNFAKMKRSNWWNSRALFPSAARSDGNVQGLRASVW